MWFCQLVPQAGKLLMLRNLSFLFSKMGLITLSQWAVVRLK